jgi:hypothetical protein
VSDLLSFVALAVAALALAVVLGREKWHPPNGGDTKRREADDRRREADDRRRDHDDQRELRREHQHEREQSEDEDDPPQETLPFRS